MPFASRRYQSTRPLRYEGKTRVDPQQRIELHRSLGLPYYLEVTDFYVGVRAGSKKFFRRVLALAVIVFLPLVGGALFLGPMGSMFVVIGGPMVLMILGAFFAAAELASATEECLTFLKDQDRFLSCFWEQEPTHAMVEAFYLRKRKLVSDDDVRWVAELSMRLREQGADELFVACGQNMRLMKPVAERLAKECDVELRVQE